MKPFNKVCIRGGRIRTFSSTSRSTAVLRLKYEFLKRLLRKIWHIYVSGCTAHTHGREQSLEKTIRFTKSAPITVRCVVLVTRSKIYSIFRMLLSENSHAHECSLTEMEPVPVVKNPDQLHLCSLTLILKWVWAVPLFMSKA